MQDNFYDRLDFYRLLEAGLTNMQGASEALGIHRGTLWRWKKAYDPSRGPFGGAVVPSSPNSLTDRNVCPPTTENVCPPTAQWTRGEIFEAMRKEALEGSVPAAKLLLSEYQGQTAEEGDILTVEGAVELLQKWCDKNQIQPQNP